MVKILKKAKELLKEHQFDFLIIKGAKSKEEVDKFIKVLDIVN